jgi:hypothetical protein
MVVDFYTRQEITIMGTKIVKVPRNREEFLETCKETLEPDDYVDVLCGILDNEIYCSLEEPICKVIDSYYSFKS